MLQHIHPLLWCRVRDAKRDPGTQEPLSHLHSRVGQEKGGRALLEGGEITGMSCPTHAGCLLGCFQLSMLLLLFHTEKKKGHFNLKKRHNLRIRPRSVLGFSRNLSMLGAAHPLAGFALVCAAKTVGDICKEARRPLCWLLQALSARLL